MTGFNINIRKLNPDRITLNLRRDECGYYWETELGEDTDARFNNPQAALSDVIVLWSTGYAEDCPKATPNQSRQHKDTSARCFALP